MANSGTRQGMYKTSLEYTVVTESKTVQKEREKDRERSRERETERERERNPNRIIRVYHWDIGVN